MPARITCPHCHQDLRLPEDLYEGPAECPCCEGAFAIRWHPWQLREAEGADGPGQHRPCRSCGKLVPVEARECPYCERRL